MSRLKSLQSRLQSIQSRDERDDTNNTGNLTGTGTYNLTDHTSWIDRISAAGNKPSDWLEFLSHSQGRSNFSSPQARHTYLLSVYDKALRHMPVELCRKDESYAKILIQLAHIKGDHNEEDGQSGFKFARVNAKTFAFVHVAAAQFELSRGREEKAQSILQKGLDVGAEPTDMLNTALIRLGNKEKLLVEDKENVWGIRCTDSVQPFLSVSKPKGPTSTKPQPPVHQAAVDPSPSLPAADSTIVFQQQGRSRDSGGSSSHDETDTLPLLWGHRGKPPQMSRSTWSASKLTGRELHTPQSQTHRVLTSHTDRPNVHKRQPARVPLRVKRSSLPKLREMSSENADSDDSDDTDGFLGIQPLKNISPPTEGLNNTTSATAKPPLPPTGQKVSPEAASHTTDNSKTFMLCKFSKSSTLLSHATPRGPAKETSPTENTTNKATEQPKETSRDPSVSNARHHSGDTHNLTSNARKPTSISPTSTVVSFPGKPQPSVKVATTSDTAEAATLNFRPMQTPGALPSQPHVTPRIDVYEAEFRSQPHGNKTTEQPHSQHAHQAPEVMVPTYSKSAPEASSGRVSHEMSGGQGSSAFGTGLRGRTATGPTVVPKHSESQMPTPTVGNKNTMPGFFTPSASLPGAHQQIQQPQNFQQLTAPPQPQFATPRMPCAPVERNDFICVKGKTFRILSIIGKGGSSKVYQVYDDKGKVFALKLVNLEEADETTVQGYINEITHLSNLQHSPRVIKLYDYEVTEERIVLVMEKGSVDLATFLRNEKKRQGSIAEDVLWFYWRHMLEAVDTIHRQGIVHSDLKPANFLFVDGNLKLIDFGIANAIQSDKTSVIKDQQVGTLNYMSPETIREYNPAQYRDGNSKKLFKINCRSDVWSLGCILYYMVYGKTPFQHIPNHFAKLQAIVDTNYQIDFPPIKNKLLLDVLKKCLIRDPYNRPSTADLLAHPYLSSERSSGAKEQPCPAAPALPMTADQIQQLLTQLSQAQSMSPNSISTVSKGLAAQLQSGQAPHLSPLLRKNRQPSQDKENLPPQDLLGKGPGCTLQHALPRPPSEHTLGKPWSAQN